MNLLYSLKEFEHVFMHQLKCIQAFRHLQSQAKPDLLESAGEILGILRTLREPPEHMSRAESVQKVSREHSRVWNE